MNWRGAWDITKGIIFEFLADQPFMLAAALSYYALLSMAPLLLIVVAVAGLFFGEQAVRGELVGQLRTLTGEEAATVIEDLLAQLAGPGSGWSLAIGLVALLPGATTVFAALQTALNQIWDVKAAPNRSAIRGFIRARLLSLGVVLAMGFLLLASLLLSAGLTAAERQLDLALPGFGWMWQALNALVSFAIITLLIALIFKYLPDVTITWRDVWIGAAITSGLFAIGKFLIGLYLGRASVGSAYGAAGLLVVLLVWVYYSALILLLGAEITQTSARRLGTRIEPAPHAVRVER